MKKLFYLAGPMRGIKWYNYPEFDKHARWLIEQGHHVINPADIDRRRKGYEEWICWMVQGVWNWNELPSFLSEGGLADEIVQHLKSCDAIALLPGWEKSKGARAENAMAELMGLEVYLFHKSPCDGSIVLIDVTNGKGCEPDICFESSHICLKDIIDLKKEMCGDDTPPRKQYPIASGVLDYFPDAIKAIAHCSWVGNEQHNPGEPLHWSRHKSDDHTDCLIRHFTERGTVDDDGVRHMAKAAWRALALLQLELEQAEHDDA